MASIIKVHAFGDGSMLLPFRAGMWVQSYDVDALPDERQSYFRKTDGCAVVNGAFGGRIVLTPHREGAKQFADNAAAMIAWNTQSTVRPLRPDGRPNKPLTTLTVEIEPC